MKMFFNDKYGRSIECESFDMREKFTSTKALYILDKKRECLIVNEEVGLQLVKEKKHELSVEWQ